MSPFKIMDQLPYLLTVKTKNEMEEITIKKAQKMVDDWVNTLEDHNAPILLKVGIKTFSYIKDKV